MIAETTLRAYELRGDDAAGRREYRNEMELACREYLRGELSEEEEEARRALLRGWYIGEPTFRDRILDSAHIRARHVRTGTQGQLRRDQAQH